MGLLSIFYKSEEETSTPTSTATVTVPNKNSTVAINPYSTVAINPYSTVAINPLDTVMGRNSYAPKTSTTEQDGAIDPKWIEYFDKVLNDANLPGPDFYELMMAIEPMKAYIPDEQNLFNAAFAPLKVQGVTKEKLLTSGNAYLNVLNQKSIDFMSKAKVEAQKQVGDSQKQVTDLMARNTELQTELNANLKTIGDLTANIERSTSALQKTSDGFRKHYGIVTTHISDLIESIKKHIS